MNEQLPPVPQAEGEPLTPSQEIAAQLAIYGEDYGFDADTLRELSSLPFEEAFEMATGYLAQAGLPEDEILAPWTEPPA